jgi:hypothetical protein
MIGNGLSRTAAKMVHLDGYFGCFIRLCRLLRLKIQHGTILDQAFSCSPQFFAVLPGMGHAELMGVKRLTRAWGEVGLLRFHISY